MARQSFSSPHRMDCLWKEYFMNPCLWYNNLSNKVRRKTSEYINNDREREWQTYSEFFVVFFPSRTALNHQILNTELHLNAYGLMGFAILVGLKKS